MSEPRTVYVPEAGMRVTDLQMMQNPEWWPHVILPLINRSMPAIQREPFGGCAILVESGADRANGEESMYLFIINQSMLAPIDMTNAVYLPYEWLSRITDDGWEVD